MIRPDFRPLKPDTQGGHSRDEKGLEKAHMGLKISRFLKNARGLKRQLDVYRLIFKDKRTPLAAKLMLGAAIGYMLMPFDIIPDFIPIAGQIDDLIIVPLLIALAMKLVPEEVKRECRTIAEGL